MLDTVVAPAFADMPNVLISASPRRDWFISSEKDLAALPRIVGGMTEEAGDWAVEVNRIVCREVIRARSHREAAATKALENALRNISINVVNQLARDTELDIREVCDLVATKWNVGRYNPSIGIGGYCIPLGPGYLMDGNSENRLGLLRAAVQETNAHIAWVATRIVEAGFKKVTVLGLAYRGDVPVYKSSPPVEIARMLAASNVQVTVSDAYATSKDYDDMFAAGPRPAVEAFPGACSGADLVIVGSFHHVYSTRPVSELMAALRGCKVIIDNEGAFAHVPASAWAQAGISYRRPGERGWLSFDFKA
jgi:nucleotide sugar dehydrogenase